MHRCTTGMSPLASAIGTKLCSYVQPPADFVPATLGGGSGLVSAQPCPCHSVCAVQAPPGQCWCMICSLGLDDQRNSDQNSSQAPAAGEALVWGPWIRTWSLGTGLSAILLAKLFSNSLLCLTAFPSLVFHSGESRNIMLSVLWASQLQAPICSLSSMPGCSVRLKVCQSRRAVRTGIGMAGFVSGHCD